ncbi:MAG: hydrogen gas-evolving membrane-bound hydrogenase subunit E [Thermodesulfobacteriota bacterium]|nr:hydrogen gas-evolving membrane-bound hydrogenase subunit E [Thermodesulfobacteriota bacterium]
MKTLSVITGVLVGAGLIYGTLDMPKWGDPHSAASTHVSAYYLHHSLEQTATPNVVTSVLADYRGYDTLGETTVIFTAGMACILLLRRGRSK